MTVRQRYIFSSAVSLGPVPDSSIAIVVTSPPYPMIEMWDEDFSAQCVDAGTALARGDGNEAFEHMHRLLDRVWAECARVLIPGGYLCINIGDAVRTVNSTFRLYPNHARVIAACGSLGLDALPLILWRKPTNAPNKFMGSGMLPAGAYVTLEHEYILIFRKAGRRQFGTPAERTLRRESGLFWEERNAWFSDLWEFRGARQNGLSGAETRGRSAAFPFELAFRLVNMFSIRGDTVLDPFLGTGTTSLACIASGRNCIGCEISPSLRPAVNAAVRNFAPTVNTIIASRIRRHMEFIERYRHTRGEPRHKNRVHGFPVVTSHETGIALPFVSRIIAGADTVESEYTLRPEELVPPETVFIERGPTHDRAADTPADTAR